MAKLEELHKDFRAVETIARGADFPKQKQTVQTTNKRNLTKIQSP